jgi:hypothetical protein
VDNRLIVDVGSNAHSVSDHTQSNWNGIVGRIAMAAGSPIWMHNVRLFADVAQKTLTLKIDISSTLGAPVVGTVRVEATSTNSRRAHHPPPVTGSFAFAAMGGLADLDLATKGGHIDIELPLGEEALTWDEFDPALYALTVTLEATARGQVYQDRRTLTAGLREVSVVGTQLAINGRRFFVRGTLECCIFPLTGYPPTDVAAWKRIIRVCKAYGLNLIRFHSWCPPEAAFVAADEEGFYFQVECPVWANQGATIGEARPLDEWIYDEAGRILAAYGNHPSFVMMAHGNEPSGRHEEFLGQWVAYWRKRDPRRLYTSGAGWPVLPESDYHNIPQPRVQHWGEGIQSRINSQPPETASDYSDFVARLQKPIVSHEIGQWCVYPNFAEMEKYTGSLKPKNFEIFRDFLNANHMGDQAHDFLMASGKLQVLCYKEDIEAALRTPGFAGFHLLDLHDFPGQGTALVGVLDPFWDEKGYVTAAEFSRFCNSVVPLALLEKRYWTTDEPFHAEVRVAQFGPHPLRNAKLAWRVVGQDGQAVDQGELALGDLPVGNDNTFGPIRASLESVAASGQLKLVLAVQSENAPRVENDWDIWVFAPVLAPARLSAPEEILVTGTLDEEAESRLASDGKVLLLPDPKRVYAPSQIGFSSIFWNTAWTRGQAPHTLGILCDPEHPLFQHFPTRYHSDWQWWELIHGSAAMLLDGLPPRLRPLVQTIDTWFEARRLGLVFEARVEGGSLLVCSMDLHSNLDRRLVARQMWASLIAYMSSGAFAPQVEVAPEAIHALLAQTR